MEKPISGPCSGGSGGTRLGMVQVFRPPFTPMTCPVT